MFPPIVQVVRYYTFFVIFEFMISLTAEIVTESFDLFMFSPSFLSANRSDLRMNFGPVHENTRIANLVTKAVAVSVVTPTLLILVLVCYAQI